MVLRLKYIVSFLLLTTSLQAQQLALPLHRFTALEWEAYMNALDSSAQHTGFKPVIEKDTMNLAKFISLHSTWNKPHFSYLLPDRTWLKRKLRYESLFGVRAIDFMLEINPLINVEMGRDVGRDDALSMFKNTRGFQINGHITEKFSFSTSFYENQWRVQTYLMEKALEIGPERFTSGTYKPETGFGNFFGQGRTKPFKVTAFDFAMATGYVSFKPAKFLHVLAGNDKLFVGHGYRSMLLSDNSFSYPFAKITAQLFEGKLEYSVTYAGLQSLRRMAAFNAPEAIFERKFAAFHYVSLKLGKRTELGLFESGMLRRMDTQTLKPFDFSYLNPLIGVNSVRFGLDSNQNTMLGVNVIHRLTKELNIYGQFALDGISITKTAFQIGTKWFSAFGFKGMTMQLEYNYASKYTYTHTTRLQGYWHYNLPLAHPWGGGFQELVYFFNYRWNDFFTETRVNYGTFKLYDNAEWGKNLLLNYNASPVILETNNCKVVYIDLKMGYIINPITNLRMMIGFTNYYKFIDRERYNSNYLYISLSTSLTNLYLDI